MKTTRSFMRSLFMALLLSFRLAGFARQIYDLGVGQQLAPDGAAYHLKGVMIVVDFGGYLRTRGFLAVREYAGSLRAPAVAVARPHALAESAVAAKDPGADRLLRRIPADHLRALVLNFAVGEECIAAGQEILVPRPIRLAANFDVAVLIFPFADQPFQFLQFIIVRVGARQIGLAHAVEQPTSVLLDQNHGKGAVVRTLIALNEGRSAVDDRNLGTDKADGVQRKSKLHTLGALGFLQPGGIVRFDSFAAAHAFAGD